MDHVLPSGVNGTATERLAAAAELVDAVVHDLNNALLVIRGYSTVLRSSLDAPEQLADVDEITKAVDHATMLARRLLEISHGADAAPETPAFAHLEQGSETILLVEDEDLVRELVCRVLESVGYHVLHASRPSEAETLLERELGIDLLLTDVVMPEMNGFDLAAHLTELRPGLRTLFISGNAYVAAGSMRADAELLKKPFEPADLTRAVRRSLDGLRPAVTR